MIVLFVVLSLLPVPVSAQAWTVNSWELWVVFIVVVLALVALSVGMTLLCLRRRRQHQHAGDAAIGALEMEGGSVAGGVGGGAGGGAGGSNVAPQQAWAEPEEPEMSTTTTTTTTTTTNVTNGGGGGAGSRSSSSGGGQGRLAALKAARDARSDSKKSGSTTKTAGSSSSSSNAQQYYYHHQNNDSALARPGLSLPPGGLCAPVPTQGDPAASLSSREILEWGVARHAITIVSELDRRGSFGPVFLAQHHTRTARGHLRCAGTVDVELLPADADTQTRRAFVHHARLLSNLPHAHVRRLHGVTIDGGDLDATTLPAEWRMILEAAPGGNALTFVRRLRTHGLGLTRAETVSLAADAACGMAYLSSRGLVHRALALRSCVVGPYGRLMVAGLEESAALAAPGVLAARRAERTLTQLRWLSPELLKACAASACTPASDAWAFGVLLWELASDGKKPYRAVADAGLEAHLAAGRRLAMPPKCDAELAEVARDCWAQQPEDRPDFDTLLRVLLDLRATIWSEEGFAPRNLVSLLHKHEADNADGAIVEEDKTVAAALESGRGIGAAGNVSGLAEVDITLEQRLGPAVLPHTTPPLASVYTEEEPTYDTIESGVAVGSGAGRDGDGSGGGNFKQQQQQQQGKEEEEEEEWAGPEYEDVPDETVASTAAAPALTSTGTTAATVSPSSATTTGISGLTGLGGETETDIYATPIPASKRRGMGGPELPVRQYHAESLPFPALSSPYAAPVVRSHTLSPPTKPSRSMHGRSSATTPSSRATSKSSKATTAVAANDIIRAVVRDREQDQDQDPAYARPSRQSDEVMGDWDPTAHVWFHESPSKKAAMRALTAAGMEDGLFLVRTSKARARECMLVLCSGGTTHNYRIRCVETAIGTRFQLQESVSFDSLPSLIEFYSNIDGGERLATRLCRPCPALQAVVRSGGSDGGVAGGGGGGYTPSSSSSSGRDSRGSRSSARRGRPTS